MHEIPSVILILLKTISITVTKLKITDRSQVKMNVRFQFCLSHVGMKWEMFFCGNERTSIINIPSSM